MSYNQLLRPGDRIKGKWNGRHYIIERCLGAGVNGQVYLAVRNQQLVALKVGYDSVDFQSEINGLLDLQKAAEARGKFLYDTDDLRRGEKDFPFYVMKYVEGIHPARFLYENGMDWYPVIGYRLLSRLAELHEHGYVFGDLKSDNILVSGYGTAELIDYGGLTMIGKAVRQYSERYDRGYWRAGSRSADASYDLFSFAVMCIELADPQGENLSSLERDPDRSVEDLCELTGVLPATRKVAPVIRACLRGQMKSTEEAQLYWRRSVYTASSGSSVSSRSSANNQEIGGRARLTLTAGLAAAFAVSLAVFGAVLYWTLNPSLLP